MQTATPGHWLRGFAYTSFALIAFAANSVLCRMALGASTIDAASFATIRLASGAVALVVISAAVSKKSRVFERGNWVSAAMLFSYAAAFSFAYISLSTGTGALILFGSVQATMILWALRSGERPHRLEWLGFVLALGGLVYLVFPGITAPSTVGSALMAIAGISWGIYSLRGRGTRDPLADTTGNFVRALPLVLTVSLFTLEASHLIGSEGFAGGALRRPRFRLWLRGLVRGTARFDGDTCGGGATFGAGAGCRRRGDFAFGAHRDALADRRRAHPRRRRTRGCRSRTMGSRGIAETRTDFGINTNKLKGGVMTTKKWLFALIVLILSGVWIGLRAMQSEQKDDAGKYTIQNCVNTFTPDKIEKTKVGYQYWFADQYFADGKTVKLSVIGSHLATHPPHAHLEDEFFFVLEGKAEFYLNGETRVVEKNTSLYCPSNVMHGIRNVGATELKYLVIKKYEKGS